jgi:RNA polymerase primary sigma factor
MVNRMDCRFDDRSSIVSRYLSEIGEIPLLSEEEEQELAASLLTKNKAEAIHKLVESNLPFVVRIASEFKNSALPFEDLLNEGNLGLIEAARHFDPRRGTRFITYAVWWIRKSILLALSRNSNVVRIPRYQIHMARQVRATERALTGELGRHPDREELSRELQSTIARVDRVLQLRHKALSLDDKVGPKKDTPIADFLVDEGEVNPEKKLLREESHALIHLVLKSLTHQEKTVIIHRFGLAGRKALTLKEVGKRLGITAERVRQIESQARTRLRKLIGRNRGIPSTSKAAPEAICPA